MTASTVGSWVGGPADHEHRQEPDAVQAGVDDADEIHRAGPPRSGSVGRPSAGVVVASAVSFTRGGFKASTQRGE